MTRKKINIMALALVLSASQGIAVAQQADHGMYLPDNNPGSIEYFEEEKEEDDEEDGLIESLYNKALTWLKTPYRYGGNSRRGIDCSALTGALYREVFGIELNRRSKDISTHDVHDVRRQDDLKPGDLVFFATSRSKKGVNHVGVYLGDKQFVHASSSQGVTISNLDEPYYKRTYVKGGAVKKAQPNFNLDPRLNANEQSLYVEAKPMAKQTSTGEMLLRQAPEGLLMQ